MPITKRQFELGVDEAGDTFMRQIYELLADNTGSAYSREELGRTMLGDSYRNQQYEQFITALDALVRIHAVERRDVTNTAYYAFSQKFDTDSWEPDYSDF